MKRLAALTAVALAVLGTAVPAWAHEEINPSTFAINKPTFLSLTAANEKDVKLTKVTLTAPQGLAFGETTRTSPGWATNRTDTVITWTNGSVDPDHYDAFGFEIEGATQPGTLSYKATLGYADGSSDDVTVQVTATAAGASASAGSSGSGSGRATAALVIGILALLAAVAALVQASRSGRSPAGGPGAQGATAQQDW
jgi:uncharacterized protein YcnI